MSYSSYENPDPRKAAITVGDFLSMSSGLDCNDHSATSPGRETVLDDKPDWVKATLDLPLINPPGTKAYYCSGGVAVVGRHHRERRSHASPGVCAGQPLRSLGDCPNRLEVELRSNQCRQRIRTDLHAFPRYAQARISDSNGGRWRGRQASPNLGCARLAEHSHVDNVSYGYFWWRRWLNVETPAGPQRVDLIAAQGNGGQKIYLAPSAVWSPFTPGALQR